MRIKRGAIWLGLAMSGLVSIASAGGERATPAAAEPYPDTPVEQVGSEAIDTPAKPEWDSPAEQGLAIIAALRENNFGDLILAAGGEEAYQNMRRGWEDDRERRAKRKTEQNKEELAESGPPRELEEIWAKLLTDEGVEALVQEWQPQVAETAQTRMVEFNLGLATMMNALADQKDITPEQQAQQRDLLLAVQAWANRTDFSDPTRVRRVVQTLATEARATGAATVEDLFAQPFDHAIKHGDGLLRALRAALGAYDIDAADILRSVRIEETAREGDRVSVHYEGRVLGVRLTLDKQYRAYYSRWADAKMVDEMTDAGYPESNASSEAANAASAEASAAAKEVQDAEAAKAKPTPPKAADGKAEPIGKCSASE